MGIREELNGALQADDFPSSSLLARTMMRLDEPAPSSRRWQGVAGVVAVLVAGFAVGAIRFELVGHHQAQPAATSQATVALPSAQEGLVSIGVSGAGSVEVSPKAPFRVVRLGYIPMGLTQSEYTYVPPSTSPSAPQRAVTLTNGSPVSEETLSAESRLVADGRGGLFLRFSAPVTAAGYLEVTQQPLRTGQTLPSGDSVAVGAIQAIVVQEGETTKLFLTRFGTVVTIQSSLGRQEAVKVAEALTWN